MARNPMKNVGSYPLTAEMLAVCVGPNDEEISNSSTTVTPAVEPELNNKNRNKKPVYVNTPRGRGRR